MVHQLERAVNTEEYALRATLNRLTQTVGALLNVSSVSIALLEQETGDLVTWAALGAGPDGPRRTRFRPNEGIAGWVATHLEPLMINDVMRDPRFKPLGGAQIGSMICIPLIDDDQLLGALTVSSPEVNAFDERRQQLLWVFSDQAALAISKTRQVEIAKAQARELSFLLDATRSLTSSLDQSHIFQLLVSSIPRMIACDDAIIYIYDDVQDALIVMTGFGPRLSRLRASRVSARDPHSLAAWVAANMRGTTFAAEQHEMGQLTEALLGGENLSLLGMPLISHDRVSGVVVLARKEPFSSQELGIMLNFSAIVAAALENAKLYQAARTEREQQAAVYAAASDAIAIVDLVGDNLIANEVNDALARLAERPPSLLHGRRLCESLRAHTPTGCPFCEAIPRLRVMLSTEGPQAQALHIECALLPGGPSPTAATSGIIERRAPSRYLDFSVTVVPGPLRPLLLLVGRDITAFREMEQMKNNFLSMVSHELRSPLQSIIGSLDYILSGAEGELAPQQREFIRRALAGGEHMTALVDDLLLISRDDAGLFKLLFAPTDIPQVINETIEELELFAEDAEVTIIRQIAPDLPFILADKLRLMQVLRNLLTNAIKFTPAHGSVTIAVEASRHEVTIRVSDTGAGIAPEHLDKIFDRFFQAPSPVRRRAQGQGLGLAIVRLIVERHNGRIQVQSAPGVGSAFTIILPRTQPDPDDEPSAE